MAGRINDADIGAVRDRVSITDVVGEYVALRRAGGDSMKGLCPFHEERTPSFNVSAGRGTYHCFGCGVGGDVIDFIRRIEQLSFVEAIERLAAQVGIRLRYEGGGAAAPRNSGERTRSQAVNKAAAEFYLEQLLTPAAKPAREFLAERGFDREAAAHFGCGYAPQSWDAVTKHLRGKGFTDREIVTAGVARTRDDGNGLLDRFRGRLIWPIRSVGNDVVGFGARKLSEDDNGPKYLNTPETPLYKKSQVLYGVDLAKREIAQQHRVVIVEGYTDVMACHLAGIPIAVATCGTAFGVEHINVLRRLMMDSAEFSGEVIFTFDGDAAGQQAALRAFGEDQRFVAQTFVAVEPDGLDPCELRQAHGDAGVRDLVARREPLIAFALRSQLRDHDLDTIEGRIRALRAAAPLIARIKDPAMRPAYIRKLAGDLGMELAEVQTEIARIRGTGQNATNNQRSQQPSQSEQRRATDRRPDQQNGQPAPQQPAPNDPPRPRANDPRLAVEREVLKLAIQQPAMAGPVFDEIGADAYAHPVYAQIRQVITEAGGVVSASAGAAWVERLRSLAPHEVTQSVISELAVEPFHAGGDGEPDARYVAGNLVALRLRLVDRSIAEIKSKLQRTNPLEEEDQHRRLFGDLVTREAYRRRLMASASGEPPDGA